MKKCTMYYYLAFLLCMYFFASMFYLIRTRFVGTPFKDTLSAEQLKIKKESSKVRKHIFYQGMFLSIPLTYVVLNINKK